jgi:hypothetical protein
MVAMREQVYCQVARPYSYCGKIRMYLVAWFFTGLIIGWILCSALQRLRNLNFGIPPLPEWASVALMLFFLLIAAVLLIWLAVDIDGARLSKDVLAIRSIFLGVRFQAFAFGIVVAVFAFILRDRIAGLSREFFNAILGNGEQTAWPLQSAVALVVVVAVVIGIRPDLLAYLRSFKVGGFEATFAESSTLVREAKTNLNLSGLSERFTLKVYRDFEKYYLKQDSDRGRARLWFDKSGIEKERSKIAATLFAAYIDPVIVSLTCLEERDALEIATSDQNLIGYGTTWKTFLLELNNGKADLSEDSIRSFLKRVRDFSSRFVANATEFASECMKKQTGKASQAAGASPEDSLASDANQIWTNFESARNTLQTNQLTGPKIYALRIIEPYLAAATGDLISLLGGDSGQKDKAEFLTKMLENFPRSDEMQSPGVINIFYQISDAKLKSPGSWPLGQTLSELDYALHGADYMIAQSVAWAIQHPADQQGADGIFDVFNRNLLILLTAKLDLFNQHALAGEAISDSSRQVWAETLSRLLAVLRARSNAPVVTSDNSTLPLTTLDKKSLTRWPMISVDRIYTLNASQATALSVILIENDRSKASALACNTSLYYIKDARTQIEDVITAHDVTLLPAQTRLKRLTSLIASRAGESCDWEESITD